MSVAHIWKNKERWQTNGAPSTCTHTNTQSHLLFIFHFTIEIIMIKKNRGWRALLANDNCIFALWRMKNKKTSWCVIFFLGLFIITRRVGSSHERPKSSWWLLVHQTLHCTSRSYTYIYTRTHTSLAHLRTRVCVCVAGYICAPPSLYSFHVTHLLICTLMPAHPINVLRFWWWEIPLLIYLTHVMFALLYSARVAQTSGTWIIKSFWQLYENIYYLYLRSQKCTQNLYVY